MDIHNLNITVKSFLRLNEWCDELRCSYKGRIDALKEAATIGSDLYHEDISPKAEKKLRTIQAWLPHLEDLCKNLQRWDKALQVVENQFDKTDIGYLIFVKRLAQITLSGWQSYNVIAGEKMGTGEKRWKLREAQYQIRSLNSDLNELDKTLTLMRESEVFFRIQNDILKIIAKSGAKESIDESIFEHDGLDFYGRRLNPAKGTSVIGALILGGIIGHSMKNK